MTERPSQPALPVLTYHSLDDSGSPVSVAPEEFRRHMTCLAGAGWRTASLDEALAGHAAGSWPARTLLLTFDDGFRSVLEHAAPVLSLCGFRALIFIATAYVGGTPCWAGQPRPVSRLPLLDWHELRRLVEAGFAVGAHSCTHARLPALQPAQIELELTRSKREIEDRCGVCVEALAYPYGARTPEIERIAGQHYRAAFGTRLAFVDRRSRPTDLERLDAYYLRGAPWVERLDGRRAAAHFRVRRLARAVRSLV